MINIVFQNYRFKKKIEKNTATTPPSGQKIYIF